jgi:hypothetical protein
MIPHISLINEIKVLIAQSREQAVRAVDHTRVLMYWNIGKRIFEEEQAGKERADYGSYLLKSLSEALQPEFGSGFSVRQLERYRQFYRMYPNTSALRTQFGWTHFKLLLSIDNSIGGLTYICYPLRFITQNIDNWPEIFNPDIPGQNAYCLSIKGVAADKK